jgi:hypothetical protein
MKRRFRVPSPALVISLIALFVALGGTTYAATSLPKNSVGTAQLKKNAITGAKIRNGAVTADKINAKGLTVQDAIQAVFAVNATNAYQALNASQAGSATNATNLGGVPASKYLQNSGNTYVQLGHANWAPLVSTDPIDITRALDAQQMTASETGSFSFRIDGVMPTSLYGKALAFAGLQICYQTLGPSIKEVIVEADTETTGLPGSLTVLVDDSTVHTDAACRTYTPSSPATLASDAQISVEIKAEWSTPGDELDLGRATAILQPTSSPAS